MKKIQVRIITFAASLLLLSFSSLSQDLPKATIVSNNTSICESAEVELKIKFEGEAPFGIVFTIFNNETEQSKTVTILKQSDAIRSEDLDAEGIWTVSYSISSTSTITLDKVFDATIPVYGTPEGPAWKLEDGSDEIFGEMKIKVDRIPDTKAGSNKKGCGLSFPLVATPTNPDSTVFWSDIAAGIFSDPNSPTTVFTAYKADTLDLIFNEISGTCIGRDTVNIEFWGSPKSAISGETTICSTDGNEHTLLVEVTLEGSAPFNYKISDGADYNQVFYNNPTGISSQLLPATGDAQYSIVEVKDFNNCPAEPEDMTGKGIVNDNKPNTFAGDDDIVCDNPKTYKLQGSDNPHENRYWSTNTDGISFNDINSDTTEVSATVFGQYTFTWTETYLGCTASDEVEIRFDEPPTLTLLQPDTAICKSSVANMRILTSSETSSYPLSLNYSIEGSSTTETINTPAISIGLSPIENSVYQLNKLTNNYGCQTDLTDEFSVDVYIVPEANAGDYIPVCGNSITLNAQLTEGNKGFWHSTNDSYFDNIQLPNATFTVPLEEQKINEDFILTWTEINGQNENCVDLQETEITLDKKPVDVYAGKDTILYHNVDTLRLDASIHENGMDTYWTDPENIVNFDSPYHPKTLATNIEFGDHTLLWTVENESCLPQTDTIIVKSRKFDAPNGFSPNNDGMNDVFRIGGAEQIPDHKFMVFDIHGKLVYSKPLTAEGWTGVDDNNKELPNGTYYYIFSGGDFEEKDYLILKSSTRP